MAGLLGRGEGGWKGMERKGGEGIWGEITHLGGALDVFGVGRPQTRVFRAVLVLGVLRVVRGGHGCRCLVLWLLGVGSGFGVK
jgi:hypothetical protein